MQVQNFSKKNVSESKSYNSEKTLKSVSISNSPISLKTEINKNTSSIFVKTNKNNTNTNINDLGKSDKSDKIDNKTISNNVKIPSFSVSNSSKAIYSYSPLSMKSDKSNRSESYDSKKSNESNEKQESDKTKKTKHVHSKFFNILDPVHSAEHMVIHDLKTVNINSELCEASLNRHNYYRNLHGSTNLELDKDLCKLSQYYAEYMASKDVLKHSDGYWGHTKKVGENICSFTGNHSYEHSTNTWYSEEEIFNWKYVTIQIGTSKFTQMIWKESKFVGFGLAKSEKGIWYSVANYYPAGNRLETFIENVKPKV